MSFRSRARELAMQAIFQNEIQGEWDREETFPWLDSELHPKIAEFARTLIAGTGEHLEEIDTILQKNIGQWKPERIGSVERAIIRMSAFSLLWQDDIPVNVTINEALELARKYCEDQSPSFINGVLDAIARDIRKTPAPLAGDDRSDKRMDK